MKKLALSVLNPISYEICMGIKTVENRTWRTDYRGKIYIHSSGGVEFPIFTDDCYPTRLLEKWDALAEIGDAIGAENFATDRKNLKKMGRYEEFAEAVDAAEKFHAYDEKMKNFYGVAADTNSDEFFDKLFAAAKGKDYFHKAFAIIGSVDLIDIVRDSPSVWAEDGCYHWILANPVLFDTPIINVKGRLRLFDVSHIIKD